MKFLGENYAKIVREAKIICREKMGENMRNEEGKMAAGEGADYSGDGWI